MAIVMEDVAPDELAAELAEKSLGIPALRVIRQRLSNSGKSVYRVDLPGGESVVLRTSTRPGTFAYTKFNLNVLRSLGLPVQLVLAAGRIRGNGSYIVLDWIPGRDLLFELSAMSDRQITGVAERVVDCQRRVARLPLGEGFGWAAIGQKGGLKSWGEMFGKVDLNPPADDGTLVAGLQVRVRRVRARLEDYFASVQATPFLDDMTAKNVIVEDGTMRGLIDADFICYGDPLLAVGATMASIAEEAPEAGAFYGEELMRCWNPNVEQRAATCFYAAACAMGTLRGLDTTTEPIRAEIMGRTIGDWLAQAEAL